MEKEIKHISGSAGGFLVGRSHANNGIKAINKATGQPLEMEGGEVVITKTAVEDEELREFEGEMLTNRQILSRINESGGGVSFALGGDIPTELYFDEKEYSYGGEKLPGHVIAYKISSCGCNQEPQNGLSEGKTIEDIAAMHNVSVSHIENQIEKGIQVESEHTSNAQEQVKIAMDHLVENPNYYDILAEANLEKGGELESFISEKFNEGFGKVKYFEISDFGGKWTYAKNPSMTRKQIESAPVYVIETSEQERNIAQEKRSNYEKSQPKEISIKEFSLKLAKENNLKITHVSKSGSVYLEKPNKETIRVSDHKILDRDPNNPKTRYDLEIVRNYFDENDSTNLSDYEENYAHGGNLKKISKIQKQEIIDSQNKFWESNDIYKLSSNGLNVLRKDNTKNPPKYKNYQSFEDFYSEILERETAKIERENATKVFDYLEQNGAELLNKSVYGSRYYYYKGNKIRVSNHWQTSEIKDSETGLNKYADLPSFYSDKPDGYKEMIEKIENLSNENYAFGGNLKKVAEIEDLDNVVQVSDNVLDAPNIIPEQATLFAEGGQVINPIVEDWDDVPANYKNINKVKKVNFANNPIDKGLDSIISPFLGNDVLRPIMGTIHFDKNGITATNAHILITLPYPNEKYEGSYDINRIKKEKSSELLLLDETYPSYEKVIPLSENAKYVYKIDVYKLLQYAQTAINYSNKVTYQAVFKFGDNEKIGFNLNFLQIILKTWLKLGHEEIYVSMTMPNRAAVFSPSKNYEVGKDEIILLMPTMVGYGMKKKEEDIHFGAMDIDYGRHLKAYFDFNDGEIHNSDGSIANFQMQYSNNLGISEDYLALLQKMTSKSRTLAILNYVKVLDGKMYATDLKTSLIVKNVDLKDGIYEIVNKAPNITMYPIEDFPKERVFNENEFQTISNVFNGPNEKPGDKIYSSFKFNISSEAFEFYLDKLLLSVGKDDLRPTMMGVCIHKTAENKIFLVSTDSNTLCKIDITEYCTFKKDDRKLEYIMSISYFKEAFDLIEGDITVKCSYSNIFIESENLDIISKNEDGKYPNYEAVIPYINSNVIKFKHAEISKCLKEKPTLDFVNKYKSEKGKTFYITNSGEKIFLVLASESYGSSNVSTIFDKLELCSIDLQYTEENTTVSFDDSLFLMMPMRLAAFENQYFAFKKSHFEIMLKTITDTEITCYYSETFKPYLFPIEEVKFNKTLSEEKTKFQKDNVIVDKKVENKIKSTQKNQLPDVGKEIVSEPQNSNEEIESTIEAINLILPSLRGKEKTEAKDTIVALKLLLETSSFEKGGPILLAPNGNPSNLDAEMYHLVRTPQFKAWFGDWENDPQNASKVVDKNGEPLVVYHGTNYDFNSFNENYKAHYFAIDEKYSDFVIDNYRGRSESARIIPAFLNIRKLQKVKFPIEKNNVAFYLNEHKFLKEINGGIFGFEDIETNDLQKLKGIDTRVYVVFNPNQIKLADGTNTTFDPNTNDIRYAKGGVINKEYNLEFKPIETPLN